MENLASVRQRHKYIISHIAASPRLIKRVADNGLKIGQVLTLAAPSVNQTGAVVAIVLGQRLAISHEIAACIMVSDIDELDTAGVSLDQMKTGTTSVITEVIGTKKLRRRLLDMGLTKNTPVRVIRTAPLGDPFEILVRGYKLTLRLEEAKCILVREADYD